MPFYALYIKTGSEEKVKNEINDSQIQGLKVFSPMRELLIRKKGKTTKQLKPFFPGYIFIETLEVTASMLAEFKKIPDFYKLLPDSRNIAPVRKEDMAHIYSFFQNNQIASLSKAKFDENDNIQIISGPLKGKEGIIRRINRRKGRAKIVIEAFGRLHTVDLGFELIDEL